MSALLPMSKTFVLLLVLGGVLLGTQAAYDAGSPGEAERDVERAGSNMTANVSADSAVNATVLRMMERTVSTAEWWAPRYHPHTKYIPYWVAQLVTGLVVTAPLTRALYAVHKMRQQQGGRA